MENWRQYLTEQKEVDWTLYGAPPGGFPGNDEDMWNHVKTKTLEEVMEHFFPFGADNLTGDEPCGSSMEKILKLFNPKVTSQGKGMDCAQHVVVYRYLKKMPVK